MAVKEDYSWRIVSKSRHLALFAPLSSPLSWEVKIGQWFAGSFCIGDVMITPSLISVPPPTVELSDAARQAWQLAAWHTWVGERRSPSLVESVNPSYDLHTVLPTGRCRWPGCRSRSAHAISWSHVWELDVDRGPMQFRIPIHLSYYNKY